MEEFKTYFLDDDLEFLYQELEILMIIERNQLKTYEFAKYIDEEVSLLPK